MGTAESKGNHRHRSSKHHRYKTETPIIQKCQHKNKQIDVVNVGNKYLSKRKHETIIPLNPNLQGSILNHSFPLQRSQSEVQITPYELSINPNQFVHDYRKDMQRVDEENRPVLEGLCPEKMYVSTNDLRICDTQRLPPPLRCKMTQGFFRSIPSSEFFQKKTTLNSSML